MSDLHISNVTIKEELLDKVQLLVTKINGIVLKDDNLICCVLGDIIDRGNAACYEMATEVLQSLVKQLTNIVGENHIAFYIVPGNHDLCQEQNKVYSLSKFNTFATSIVKSQVSYSDSNSIMESDHFGYHFINISSVRSGIYKYGELDYEKLFACKAPQNTIVLVHHSLVSSDSNDNEVIRNGYRLQQFLEKDTIIALLHGHTHGCKRYTVGHDCQVIGVGPMFKPVPDISNQCNLINVSGSVINKITTFTYQADRQTWDSIETYKKQENNNYYGSSVYHVYEQVLSDANANLLLPNMRIEVKQNFKAFEAEISDNFSSCLEEARAWQSFKRPPNLDYTHGGLMNIDNVNWDDFVVSMLKKNPTTKRAIVPLITKEMVFKGGDGKLVSFDIVQFGFLDNDCKDLYITVYLRALEVRHFMPINICEVYLMAKKIKESIHSIENVSVCLFTFRAEAKLNYGCYKKAQVEFLSESNLCRMLADRKFHDLKNLLEEKGEMGDTVIDETWLKNIQKAFSDFFNEPNRSKVLEQIDNALSLLSNLKATRANCSNYSLTQPDEDQFVQSLTNLIRMLPEA